MAAILEVKNLEVVFNLSKGSVTALHGVSLTLNKGERVALVGESGSGKTLLSLSILRLIEQPGEIKGGEILFNGRDLMKLGEEEIRKVRGNEIAMIFQEPLSSLNPVLTIGYQVAEPFLVHTDISKAEALRKAKELLKLVSIADVDRVAAAYPHELSGGMRQRAMIAMALALNPSLLLADEPTTALDVTLQAQFIELLKDLQKRLSLTLLIVTHDFGVVAEIAERVLVIYGGMIVEEALVSELFANPLHPYTKGLLASIPKRGRDGRLKPIRGQVPPLGKFPSGCPFRDRCDFAKKECAEEIPEFIRAAPTHSVRCVLYGA
jgi:oligopeptide/dipeptide ABC transporter ATP-binding protein